MQFCISLISFSVTIIRSGMNNYFWIVLSWFLFLTALSEANAQSSNNSLFNFGIWQTFGEPFNTSEQPEVKGGLTNFRWKEIEPSPGVWDWTSFDLSLLQRSVTKLPTIIMVYTGTDAPDWLYTNGVPKVKQYDSKDNMIGYLPYYKNDKYKFYFKRMITQVRKHVSSLQGQMRKQIIAVQACYGRTGDYITYYGTVDKRYELSGTDIFELFKEFSLYFYNEYKNTSPKIYVLYNPKNKGQDQCQWVINNCPDSWIKTGAIGHGYQLNDEVTKAGWLYNILIGAYRINCCRSKFATLPYNIHTI